MDFPAILEAPEVLWQIDAANKIMRKLFNVKSKAMLTLIKCICMKVLRLLYSCFKIQAVYFDFDCT